MNYHQLENPNNIVVTTARDTSVSGLNALAVKTPKDRLHLVTLDVSKESTYPPAVAAAEAVLLNGLDYLIINAGVDYQTFKTFGNDVCVLGLSFFGLLWVSQSATDEVNDTIGISNYSRRNS